MRSAAAPFLIISGSSLTYLSITLDKGAVVNASCSSHYRGVAGGGGLRGLSWPSTRSLASLEPPEWNDILCRRHFESRSAPLSPLATPSFWKVWLHPYSHPIYIGCNRTNRWSHMAVSNFSWKIWSPKSREVSLRVNSNKFITSFTCMFVRFTKYLWPTPDDNIARVRRTDRILGH